MTACYAPPRIEIYPDAIGQYRYRLLNAAHKPVMESVGAFATAAGARQSALASMRAAEKVLEYREVKEKQSC